MKDLLRPSIRWARRQPAVLIERVRLWRRPSTVRLNGILLPTAGLSRQMQDLLYCGRYENAEARLVRDYLSATDKVVEIGTGLGYLTTVCSRICGDQAVTTFEANPEMIPVIKTTFQLNQVCPDLQHGAITSGGRPVRFSICENFWSSSTIRREGETRTVTVPGVSFRDALADREPTFLLMDMEGGEVDLVDNAIPECVRHMVIELHEGIVGTEGVEKVRSWLRRNRFSVVVDHGDRSAVYLRRD